VARLYRGLGKKVFLFEKKKQETFAHSVQHPVKTGKITMPQ
jgi:hypothetical protein